MQPAFLNNDLREKYLKILLSWKGTPYRHLTAKKGRGADCTLLIAAALKELGVLKKVEYEHYPRGWHMSTTREWVLESFYHHIQNHLRKNYHALWKMEKIKEEDLMFGDVITFATTSTKVSNHCGVWLDERKSFFNSIGRRGCCQMTYGSYWEKRQTGFLRLMEK